MECNPGLECNQRCALEGAWEHSIKCIGHLSFRFYTAWCIVSSAQHPLNIIVFWSTRMAIEPHSATRQICDELPFQNDFLFNYPYCVVIFPCDSGCRLEQLPLPCFDLYHIQFGTSSAAIVTLTGHESNSFDLFLSSVYIRTHAIILRGHNNSNFAARCCQLTELRSRVPLVSSV